MTVTWGKPVNENGFIRKYTLVFSYTLDQKKTSIENSTNGQTSSYSFDVLGGIQYGVELWAETIKPGSKATSSKQVPVYSKYGFHVSTVLAVMVVAVVVVVITLFLLIGKNNCCDFFKPSQGLRRQNQSKRELLSALN